MPVSCCHKSLQYLGLGFDGHSTRVMVHDTSVDEQAWLHLRQPCTITCLVLSCQANVATQSRTSFPQVMRKTEQSQIEGLEMQLLVPDILLFRHLAAKSLKQQRRLQGLHSPLQPEGSATEVSQQVAAADTTGTVSTANPETPKDVSAKEGFPVDVSSKKRKSLDDRSPHGSGERYFHGPASAGHLT